MQALSTPAVPMLELTSSFRIAEKAVDTPKTPYGRQRPPQFMKPCPEVQHVETAIRNTELENLKAENERLKDGFHRY